MRPLGSTVPILFSGATVFGLALSGCTVPGVPRTTVLSRQPVGVDGRGCEFLLRRTETATVNGMHRYEDGVIRCNGQDYACDDRSPAQCASAFTAGTGRRGEGGPAG